MTGKVAAAAEDRSHEAMMVREEAVPAPSDVRVEDLGDGSARVSLRLPWAVVLEVLDLASRHGAQTRAA